MNSKKISDKKTKLKDKSTGIHHFTINFPDAALVDLRKRISKTRWPDKETISNTSQGVQLATMQKLAHYWQTDYDWRKIEAKLNTWPQFMTNLDGLDIHFIHVRSKHDGALPLIVTHGWPGSIIEQLKIIDPLTNPTAYGGKASMPSILLFHHFRVMVFQESQQVLDGIQLA